MMHPFLYRRSHCPWCWERLHLMRWFPGHWSSCACPTYERVMRARLARKRAAHMQVAPEVC